MKFMAGLQLGRDSLVDCIIENKDHIYEVYFSWGDFPSGRNNQWEREGYTAPELMDMQRDALKRLSDENIALNLLFNANCYGKDSLSRAFFNKIGNTVDYIQSCFGLASVTTTSPVIAKFIKSNFEDVEVRASVNMEIGTAEGMEYLKEYFDSFYIKRELNRSIESIKPLYEWGQNHGKELFMLANSGCLNFCSAHNFHDNLVAHETEISAMDNAFEFHGLYKEYLKNPENINALINNTNFIRPEDIEKYEPYFKAVKLATRVSRCPEVIINSYVNRKFSGDILSILEPAHSVYPYVLENGDPLKIVRLEEN
ncbi:MAG: hypothetical protein IKV89_01905 [Clostridia bacterium]|nr:hypothetical protein [Clostridia bacterium]